MAATPYKQDLPPKGGYAPINYKRIPARSVLNAPIIFGGLFASMAYGIWSYKRGMRAYHKVVGTVDKHPSDSNLFGSGKWNEFDINISVDLGICQQFPPGGKYTGISGVKL